ncbi:phage tail tape measure protein [Pseudomonas qingdaonensis]|uniref:phage tail tape measure protein n=1 Tax=Pseudomonas qingdaonensis TaxID=2056231 RepID=UPI002E19D97E|nr:phage tail tape measure protein [Pseudomonas qingdaonensis]
MAGKFALGLVIGGAVSATVGSSFKAVENRIKQLEEKGNRAKVLQSTIGETIRLREEWNKAHQSGAAGADKLLQKLENNYKSLKEQGVQLHKLRSEYQALGRVAQGVDLRMKGRKQIGEGAEGLKSTVGSAVKFSASLAIPTKISGDYQAQIRQMALWAHVAGENGEQQMADKIADVAAEVGMSQQALAGAVGGLIEKGIDWEESVDYAPLIADLIDGQGMEADTIATLFSAFKEAGVKKEDMGAMLGQVAAAGDIGAFGPKDMARYMPSLLGTIKKLGMEGPEAVRFLGASLQSQYKQTQDSAAAATNMNNLLNAVISGTSQERFAKEGIDLAGSIASAVKSGKADNPVDAFIKLSDVLLKRQNPSKAKEVEALKKRIQESADGSAEEAQAMASLLESAGLAGIVSDQSASAGLLAQIKYGSSIKDDMASIKETDGRVKIEQDAVRARETSNAKWSTATAAMETSMVRLGDAIRPITDRVADGLATMTYAVADLTQSFPGVVAGITGVGAALIAAKAAFSAFKIAKGVANIAKGSMMGDPKLVQRVFVTNAPAAGDAAGGGDGGSNSKKGGKGKRGGARGKGGGIGPGAVMKGTAVLAVVDAGMKVADTYQNAETRNEKAEGYGEAAGGLAGTLAGAAAGAALGSIVPGIGTAVGGIIGGILGSMGGTAGGGALGLALFGEDEKPAVATGKPSPLLPTAMPGPSVPSLSAQAQAFQPGAGVKPTGILAGSEGAGGPPMGQVVRSMAVAAPAAAAAIKPPEPPKAAPPKVEQSFTFAPHMPVTVQGDVKDPAQLARELEPHMRRQFEEMSRQAAARQLYDTPHT